jgi:hypothetical protein
MDGRLTAATLILAAALAGSAPALAGSPKLAAKTGESLSPMAGGPTSYQASGNGVCAGIQCIVTFGKKANKIRHISNVSCMLVSDGEGIGGIVDVDGRRITYLPVASRASFDNLEYAMSALAIDFEIAGGEELKITMASGTQVFSTSCTIHGTIE